MTTQATKKRKLNIARRALANPAQAPNAWVPRYAHACHHGAWKLQLRAKVGAKPGLCLQYKCGSRHHRGPCQDKWRRRLFARLQDKRSVFQSCDPSHAMFWTLTLPADWHRDPTVARRLAANLALGAMFAKFRKALNKRLDAPLQYFWIREDHKSGVPHLHLLVVHEAVAARLRKRDEALLPLLVSSRRGVHASAAATDAARKDDRALAPQWLLAIATRAGFGVRFDAQLARNRATIAHYAAKVCAQIDEGSTLAGEVTKASQAPERLPRGARSYGASRGFLAPRMDSSGAWVGWLQNGTQPDRKHRERREALAAKGTAKSDQERAEAVLLDEAGAGQTLARRRYDAAQVALWIRQRSGLAGDPRTPQEARTRMAREAFFASAPPVSGPVYDPARMLARFASDSEAVAWVAAECLPGEPGAPVRKYALRVKLPAVPDTL